jgi:hypothetical protein
MKRLLVRVIYRAVVAAHPANFRESFGYAMLETFDEAADEFGQSWLLWDAILSVARQRWTSRFDKHSESLPSVAGLRSGVYPFTGPSQMSAGKLLLATLLSALLTQCIRG